MALNYMCHIPLMKLDRILTPQKARCDLLGIFLETNQMESFFLFCFHNVVSRNKTLLLYFKNHSIVFGEVENFPFVMLLFSLR